ncbi:MAG: DEAD/DEAH box helicase [Actinomycetota bacterium]
MVVILPRFDEKSAGESVPCLPPGYATLLERLHAGHAVSASQAALVEAALGVLTRPGFDTLMCLPRLRFQPFDYQLAAARAVLSRMRGRAILADEVGLGKTVEAGLVISELILRRQADKVLVLAPVGLLEQWREELDRKFALPSEVAERSWKPGETAGRPIVLASIATARRPPLADLLKGVAWDLVVVDEAHRVKNPRSASGRLVRSLSTRHLLLLTATPVENRLTDLFELVSLVSPGLLGTAAEFRSSHGDSDHVRNLGKLRDAMRQVMIRHRRSEVALMLPRRLAHTRRITPGPDEAELYRLVAERVRAEARTAAPSRALSLLAVQRLAGSHPAVLGPLLVKVGWDDLARIASSLGPTSKSMAFIELLAGHVSRDEKVLAFTAFLPTLNELAHLAEAAGIPVVIYHGGLTRKEKDRVMEEFRDQAPVLLATESAGEGRNLQFCSNMVNFDLPWNPMQIEQRLGRIHRIGQTHEVLLTNLVSRGTLEDRILEVLESKINLFELVVGELDMILGRVEEDFEFESSVFKAHVEADDDAEFDSRLAAMGDRIIEAKLSYSSSRERIDDLAGGMGAEEVPA